MKRRDAEAAVKELDGFDWGGSVLRVGWGKMVRLPPRPLYGECACRACCAGDCLIPCSRRAQTRSLSITIPSRTEIKSIT